MALLQDLLLFLLYISVERRVQIMLSKKFADGIDLQSYDNTFGLIKMNKSMCDYPSTSVASSIINTTESTPELSTTLISKRNSKFDFNSDLMQEDDKYRDSEEENSQIGREAETVINERSDHFRDSIQNNSSTLNDPNQIDIAEMNYEDYDDINKYLATFKPESVTEEISNDNYSKEENPQTNRELELSTNEPLEHFNESIRNNCSTLNDANQTNSQNIIYEEYDEVNNYLSSFKPKSVMEDTFNNIPDEYYESKKQKSRINRETRTVKKNSLSYFNDLIRNNTSLLNNPNETDIDDINYEDYYEVNIYIATFKPDPVIEEIFDENPDSEEENSQTDREFEPGTNETLEHFIESTQNNCSTLSDSIRTDSGNISYEDYNEINNYLLIFKKESVMEDTSNNIHDEYYVSVEPNSQSNRDTEAVTKETLAYFNELIQNNNFTLDNPHKVHSEDIDYEYYDDIIEHLTDIELIPATEETYNDDSEYENLQSDREFRAATNGTSNHDFAVHSLNEILTQNPPDFTYNSMEEEKEELINDVFLDFSIKYSTVMFNHSENIITSPISASILMFMASYEEHFCTKDIINFIPSLPAEIRNDRALIKSIIHKLESIKPYGILIGHKIFIADNVELSEKFSEILQQIFESKLQQINFTNALEAAQLINNWSANQTNDSITDVVDPYQFNDETSLVFISVASFNCTWLKPFNPKNTKLMDFSVNGVYKKVWTMNQKNTFRYGVLNDFNSTYIELPLKVELSEEIVEMIIILPHKQTNVSSILSNYSKSQLRDLMHNTDKKVFVQISLPKFQIQSKINLKDKQQAMGIEIIFCEDANFPRITKSRYLKVSDFIQDSVIHVNEGNYNSKRSRNKRHNQSRSVISKLFHVNRPFIVLIANNNTILASAQVMNPNS